MVSRDGMPLPLALLLETCENGGGRYGIDVTPQEALAVVEWVEARSGIAELMVRTAAKIAGVEGIEKVMPGASRGELPDTSREVLGAQSAEVVIRTPDVYRVTEGEHVFGQKVDP